MKKTTIPCLMGPTASGKTDLALAFAKKTPCEIISVDSALVYRGMDIGTAKPEPHLREQVVHHLIDIREVHEHYSAAEFREDVLRLIPEILARGKTPLLVGGTMLYFRALQQGLAALPAADPKTREKLLQEAAEVGWSALHERLQTVDPKSAARIHPNDPQRIQRALEVYAVGGKPLSDYWDDQKEQDSPFIWKNFALIPEDRSLLHARIEQRFHAMLEQGFLAEVQALYARGDLHSDLPALRSVGYRQAWGYLAGEHDETAMIERALAATRQLAKRQLTWLRTWPGLIHLEGCLEADLRLLNDSN